MLKKIIVTLVAVLIVTACCLTFAACDEEDEPLTIVYLGDSIAEALIGPSPIAERDNYGYYAVVGKINGMRYFNHSVSGHKTSSYAQTADDDIGGLLGMLYREDENAALMKTHLEQADIIHISVLGNNILQYNLGLLLYEVAQPDFEERFKEGDGDTLLDRLYTGSREPYLDENGEHILDYNGRWMYRPFDSTDARNYRNNFYSDGSENKNAPVYFDFPPTYRDVIDAIARLRRLNPTATIIFQTVYDPYYEGSSHLRSSVINALKNVTDVKGRFGEAGKKITELSQFRKMTDALLAVLNNIIVKYMEEYKPENFYMLDVNAAFDRVTKTDIDEEGNVRLDGDCLGRQLIFTDWTHPSNLGHAIIACETQKLLEKLGYASPNALKNYKALRLEQLRRMYTGVEGVDVDDVAGKIEAADSMEVATFAYFEGIRGFTPINYGGGAKA